jgi:ATP-dependent DNA helicase RecG
MDLEVLQRHIQGGESLNVEFKTLPLATDDLTAALVAFANSAGGMLLLGVNDAGDIVGVEDGDRTMQRVDQIAYQNSEPPLTIQQEVVTTPEGYTVVVVSIPQGDLRPYRTNRGDYFIRTASGRRRATRQELLRLFQAADSLHYDETLLTRATLKDLDRYAFEDYLRRAYQRSVEDFEIGYETLLANLSLIKSSEQEFHPTVAALLFFGRDPQKFLHTAHVVAARIPGHDLAATPSDVKNVVGRLPDMLEGAMRFLEIHLPTPHVIQRLEAEARPELPLDALRELLVNALAHRDYTLASPVRVFVFDHQVQIRTPGGLPNSVKIETIRLGGAHILRNPMIYTLFRRYGLVTGVGSGVYRSIQLIRAATGEEPHLFIEGSEFVVSIPRRKEQA